MISKIRRVFNLYCERHFTVLASGFPVFREDGEKLGNGDRITYGQNSVRVEGWSIAEKIALGPLAKTGWQRPNLKRPDVTAALSTKAAGDTGFNLVFEGRLDGLMISFKSGATTLQVLLPTTHQLAV